jgi:hypothetical protein
VAGSTGFSHRRFFVFDAFACVTWVGYSLGIGVLASSFPWLHHNPLLSAGIAVVFAIVLGVVIDHALRWWHKRLGRHDAPEADADVDGWAENASGQEGRPGTRPLTVPSADAGPAAK